MKITAEGVERCSQLAVLRDSGVVLQGYLLAHPQEEALLAEAVRVLPARLESLLLSAGASTVQRSPKSATITGISDTQRRPRLAGNAAGARVV